MLGAAQPCPAGAWAPSTGLLFGPTQSAFFLFILSLLTTNPHQDPESVVADNAI